MKLLVNNKEYVVTYATNNINFTEAEGAKNHFYIEIENNDPKTFDEIASVFKTRLAIVNESNEENPDIEQIIPHDIILQTNNSEELTILYGFIPESMELNYSDNQERIQIHFIKDV